MIYRFFKKFCIKFIQVSKDDLTSTFNLEDDLIIFKGKCMSTNWVILIIAGLFEILWAIGLKYTDGFTKLTPSILTILSMLVSIWLLSISLKTLPLGTAYAVWVGIGTVGTVIAGIILFNDSVNLLRIISILFIILGIIGLKITTS